MFSFALQRPYFLCALALAAGTALGAQWAPPLALLHEPLWWCALAAALLLLWWDQRKRTTWLAHFPGLVALALAGYLNSALALAVPLAAPLRGYVTALTPAVGKASPLLRLEGRVSSFPKFQSGHLRLQLEVLRARELGPRPEPGVEPKPGSIPRWQDVRGRCMLYLKCETPPAVDYGDVVRLSASLQEELPPRNLGQFDYRRYLIQHGTVLTGYAPSAKSLDVRLRNRRPPWPQLSGLRARLTGELSRALPPDQAQLAISTVYGDKITEVSDELRERFRQAGLSHILVASGTQVSLLIALMLSLGWRRARWLGTTLRVLLALGVIFTYSILAGLETSIVRALVMGCVVLATRLLQRDGDGLSSLSQAALVLLLANPLQISSAGFLLSFMATFGLIYLNGITLPLLAKLRSDDIGLAPVILPGWRGWLEQTQWKLRTAGPSLRMWLLAGMSTTIGAQLFVLPVLASQFGQLSLWGFISNAVAVPLSFALLIFGALLSFGLGTFPLLGAGLTAIVGWSCWALDAWAELFASLPGSDLALPPPVWWQVLLAYALLLLVGERLKLRQLDPPQDTSLWTAGAMTSCVFVLAAGLIYWLSVPRPELAVLALPGAEAYFWRARDGSAWVLARQAGLGRGRNDESLQAALRYRGCNRLRGVLWIDSLPAAGAVADLRGTNHPVGTTFGRTRPAAAPQWIMTTRGGCAGAVLPVGRKNCVVLWDSLSDLAVLSAIGAARPALVCVPARLAKAGLPPDLVAACANTVLLTADGRETQLPPRLDERHANRLLSGTEVRVLPGGAGIRLKTARRAGGEMLVALPAATTQPRR